MDIVVHLSSDNFDLKMQCSAAIFKCASDKVSFHIKTFWKTNYLIYLLDGKRHCT